MVLKINREPNPEHLRKYRGLLNSVGISELQPQWKERITDFLEWLIRERTLATTYGYGVRVFEFAKYTGGDFLSPTDEELKSYLGGKKSKGVSATNINITVTALTKFYTWLLGKNPKCLENIKDEYIKGTGSKREEIITEEELDKLIQASDFPRDKALWSLLYDSGCRIGELQTLRVKDIEMNDYGLTMKVNGKTGQRWVVVVGNSIVYLQEWLKVHPTNKDRDAYVFCEIRGKSRGKFLERQRIANNLNNATERAGIRHLHPHLFRHTRASLLASLNVAEAPLESQMGWVHGSQMSRVYVDLEGKQHESAILKAYGIQKEEKPKEITRPRECPRCQELNPSNSSQCSRCFLPFDIKLVPDSELLGIAEDYKRIFRDMLFDLLEDEYQDKGDKKKLDSIKKIRDSGINLF